MIDIFPDPITSLHNSSSHIRNDIMDTIGQTPLVKLDRLFSAYTQKIYAKLESFNPGGSIKDRTAMYMLNRAMEQGELKPGQTVVESSSGNMAVGLAQACLFYGLNLKVVVDPNVNKQTETILKAYGAEIIKITEPGPNGSYLSARLEKVADIQSESNHVFWPNQYKNENNPNTHHETAREIFESLNNEIDYLFVATSTCGSLMGIADYILKNRLPTKLIAVDADSSILFQSRATSRLIPGHGAGVPSHFLEREKIADFVLVSDQACVQGCHRLLQKEAILCGGSSGAMVSAVFQYLPRMVEDDTAVLLMCDRGERYLDTIYNQGWLLENFGEAFTKQVAL